MINNILDNCKTVSANKSNINKKWVLIDATGQYLGRLVSSIASILIGKNKVYYTPFLDCGDNVIIINAEKILLSGKKNSEKKYLHHTGYPGGQRLSFSKEILPINPCKLLMHAIKGMLPKNKLGRKMLTNVRVFAGDKYNLNSVKPEIVKIKY